MSICISTHCKNYSTCKKAHPNDSKQHQAINWHDSAFHAEEIPSYAENNKFVNVQSYEDFKNEMNKAMTTPVDMRKYSDYMKKHYTSTLVPILKKIVDTL